MRTLKIAEEKSVKRIEKHKESLGHRIKNLYEDLRKENLPKLIFFIVLIVVLGGTLVFLAEYLLNSREFSDFLDSLWWSVVTITSVGYGDKVPETALGKVLATVLMLFGVIVTSVLSGTIASIFVDRKIREGKGLQDVNLKNHIVVCGWNQNAESIFKCIINMVGDKKLPIVLINEMDPEDFQALKARYPNLDIRFVRGDFTNEVILKRGSLSMAKAAIIMADVSGNNTLTNADERTILATLAIKSLNSEIVTTAEVVNPKNEAHLRRANVDDILVNGEFNGFLMATSIIGTGIPQLVREMLSYESDSYMQSIPIPTHYVGKTFMELSNHFLKTGKGILVGLVSEEKKMNLDDILSDDSSAIEDFIKRKFAEAEIDLFEQEKEELNIKLNPGAKYIIKSTDSAFIIGSAKK